MHGNKFNTIDEYIANFPKETQALLEQIRSTIKETAPEATEVISYQMPAFKLNGILVYFAAYSKHIGFYPTGSAIEVFKNELTAYKGGKGTVRFPTNQALPLELIARIVTFRLIENTQKAKMKRK
jgi:uncharacterized protein YdhG (YjbR/CyaY superfamily)